MPAGGETTAIIVTHNSAAVLPACLASVHGAGLGAIVVDNASSDQGRQLAEQAGARVIANDENQGYGRALNLGAAAAATPFCLFLNPDVQFAPEAPQRLRDAMLTAPQAVLAGPRLVEPDGRIFSLSSSPINPPIASEPSGEVCVLSGAALMVRREQFQQIGGFDPNIFLFWEDNDLCRRVIDDGGQVLFVGGARMRHVRGGSSARAPGAIYKSRWHQAWSRFYVFAKYGLASDHEAWVNRFSGKARLARLMRAKERIERYQGSLDGALAFQRGESALAHEGLQ